MTVRRVMGSESEFGLVGKGLTDSAHSYLSAVLVSAYADLEEDRAWAEGRPGFLPSGGWDYSTERPLADARGFVMSRAAAHPSQLTDQPAEIDGSPLTAEQIAAETASDRTFPASATARSRRGRVPLGRRGRDELVTNLVLTNGARYYVDHAHPEYSSPEVLTPQEIVLWDLAGDIVAQRSAEAAAAAGLPPIELFKNNTDGKSTSYGTHENYLVDRSVPFETLVERLLPFFATRQILCGAGRVGIGIAGTAVKPTAGFQVSQRADFFEERVGLETTLRRPIVNARDEPHADDSRFRRLHVIIGDANLAPTSILVRFGATSLVLKLIEDGLCPALELEDPVTALQTVSHDIPAQAESTAEALSESFRSPLPLADGTTTTAFAVQRAYLDAARAAYTGADPETDEILDLWTRILDGLESDPLSLAGEVDWIAKFRVIDAIRRRDRLDWDDVRLHAVDLQYSLLDPARGLALRLRAQGALQGVPSPASLEEAVTRPPSSTRAAARGRSVRDYADRLVSASWDTLTFALPGRRAPVRLILGNPLTGDGAFLDSLPAGCSAEDFADALRRAIDEDSCRASAAARGTETESLTRPRTETKGTP